LNLKNEIFEHERKTFRHKDLLIASDRNRHVDTETRKTARE